MMLSWSPDRSLARQALVACAVPIVRVQDGTWLAAIPRLAVAFLARPARSRLATAARARRHIWASGVRRCWATETSRPPMASAGSGSPISGRPENIPRRWLTHISASNGSPEAKTSRPWVASVVRHKPSKRASGSPLGDSGLGLLLALRDRCRVLAVRAITTSSIDVTPRLRLLPTLASDFGPTIASGDPGDQAHG